jgi:hypothetical protein
VEPLSPMGPLYIYISQSGVKRCIIQASRGSKIQIATACRSRAVHPGACAPCGGGGGTRGYITAALYHRSICMPARCLCLVVLAPFA